MNFFLFKRQLIALLNFSKVSTPPFKLFNVIIRSVFNSCAKQVILISLLFSIKGFMAFTSIIIILKSLSAKWGEYDGDVCPLLKALIYQIYIMIVCSVKAFWW